MEFYLTGNDFKEIIPDASKDAVSFLSVLFLVEETTRESLLNESLRMLKTGGKVFVLTPSAKGSWGMGETGRSFWKNNNWTFLFWRTLTRSKAGKWVSQNWLEQYASRNNLGYSREIVYHGYAVVEVLEK